MPDPVVPGPPASVLAQISNNPGSDLPLSNPAFTGRATFSGVNAGAFPFLPSLMTEVVDMPQAGFLDADVEIGGNLTVDGTFFAPVFALLEPVSIVTGSTTAAAGQFIPCSTASTALTVTLPAAPQDGTLIGVQMVVQASSRAVTVAAAGTDKFNVAGGPTTLSLSSLDQGVLVQYSQVAGLWYQIATSGSSGGGSPTGSAGGALSGTYPNPGFAVPGTFSASQGSATILSVANTASAPTAPAFQVTSAASGDRAVGVQVSGDTNHRFRSDSTGLLSWGPGTVTADVQFSRTGAGQLTAQPVSGSGGLTVSGSNSAAVVLGVVNTASGDSSPAFQVTTGAAGDRAIGALASGDAVLRYRVGSDGKQQWGSGSGAQDTNLYRSGAGTVTTDNTLSVGTNLTVSGTVTSVLNMGGNTLTHAGSQQVTLPWMAGAFGDGSDGACALNGTNTFGFATLSAGVYTLTRDVFATSLTATASVVPAGWRMFCAGTVTNSGTIAAVGNNATAGTNQHTAAGATPTGTLGGGRSGSAGVASGTASTATASTGVGTGAPGAGGNGTTGSGGQSAGTPPSTDVGWLRTPWPALATALFNTSAVQRVDGGGGGSGGGGDGTNFGGGGGGGGGVVGIFAWSLVNNGVITAAGGNGGTPSTVVTNGGCGGGGGGAGGLILAYTLTAATGSGSTSVAGGNGGTKVTNGSGTAQNGSNGASGNYLNIVLT